MRLDSDIPLAAFVDQFRGLRMSEPERWPAAPRLLCAAGIAAMVISAGWQFNLGGKREEFVRKRAAQASVRLACRTKALQVAKGAALRQQKAALERQVAQAERWLPDRAGMDALLADINRAGVALGLQFELFQPQAATVGAYLAEIPVHLRIVGGYHDLARFLAELAALSRVVAVRDLQLTAGRGGVGLTMDAVAIAFRTLDNGERAAQRGVADVGAGVSGPARTKRERER